MTGLKWLCRPAPRRTAELPELIAKKPSQTIHANALQIRTLATANVQIRTEIESHADGKMQNPSGVRWTGASQIEAPAPLQTVTLVRWPLPSLNERFHRSKHGSSAGVKRTERIEVELLGASNPVSTRACGMKSKSFGEP